MDALTALRIAADLAASALLLLLFLVELLAIAVLWGLWRALGMARAQLPGYLKLADGEVRRAELQAREATDAALRPQIELASRVAGAKAAVRALVGRQAPASASPSPPPPTPSAPPSRAPLDAS